MPMQANQAKLFWRSRHSMQSLLPWARIVEPEQIHSKNHWCWAKWITSVYINVLANTSRSAVHFLCSEVHTLVQCYFKWCAASPKFWSTHIQKPPLLIENDSSLTPVVGLQFFLECIHGYVKPWTHESNNILHCTQAEYIHEVYAAKCLWCCHSKRRIAGRWVGLCQSFF